MVHGYNYMDYCVRIARLVIRIEGNSGFVNLVQRVTSCHGSLDFCSQ